MKKSFDGSNLSFGYQKTDWNVRCYYKDGKWGDIEVSDSENITLSIAATCLHYGQEAFEGLKAYHGKEIEEIRSIQFKLLNRIKIEKEAQEIFKMTKLEWANPKIIDMFTKEKIEELIRPLDKTCYFDDINYKPMDKSNWTSGYLDGWVLRCHYKYYDGKIHKSDTRIE